MKMEVLELQEEHHGNLMAHFHSNCNNHAQYEASRSMPKSIAMTEYSRKDYSSMVTTTTTAGVTDNPSTLVVNTSENKENKASVAFLFTIADKMPILSALIISGLVYSHGPTRLLGISDAWIQVLFAGGVISTISCIILAGSASYFKEKESPDHPGFVVCSMMVFCVLLFLLLLTFIILLGFERTSKCVIWSIGFLLLLLMVLVWVVFQHHPMIVGLKWAKNALQWMLKWAKNAFEWMKSKISEWRLWGESLPQMQA